jgi:hypothetical protein
LSSCYTSDNSRNATISSGSAMIELTHLRFCVVLTGIVLWCSGCGGTLGQPIDGGTSDTTVSCNAGEIKCAGNCTALGSDNNNCGACGTVCEAVNACFHGACSVTCGGVLTNCSATCVDTKNDPAHCGTCSDICAPSDACVDGECVPLCSSGLTRCDADAGTTCVDTTTDHDHCGSCAQSCPTKSVRDSSLIGRRSLEIA